MIWRLPVVGRVIDTVPQPWIVGVQLYRALGVIFLILYAADKMPGLFAWPAGVGDVVVGLLAPVVALAYARDPQRNVGRVTTWNVLGILDLVVAIATGFITSPSTLFSYEPPNELIAIFPLVLTARCPNFVCDFLQIIFLAGDQQHYAGARKRHRFGDCGTYSG